MKILRKNDNYIEIELDNGNTISLTEVESGTVQFENTTDLGARGLTKGSFGLLIEPIGQSIIAITPEG